jgi:NADH:ubiquinone oxidoreductase subunit E
MLNEKVMAILKKWEFKGDNLIEIMHDLQTEFNYLPKPVIKEIAKQINVPLSKIYHVATFYQGFSLTERGKHTCAVCIGTPCHVKGAPQLIECIERELNIKVNETDKDKLFTLKTSGCVGTCGLAPVVVIGDELYGNLTQAKMKRLIKQYQDREKKDAGQEKGKEVKHAQA